jgi:hemerythrin-like domain-containing protein
VYPGAKRPTAPYHGGMSKLSLPGFNSPGASTEAPLEMLAACHGRVHKQCETLGRLAAHLPTHGSDTAAQQAATAVTRYFDTAARDHHADEEEDLFPALLEAMAGSDAVCLRALTDGLVAEHRLLEARWHQLREVLTQISQGQPVELPASQVQDFVDAYAAHIEKEDTELLPMAARLLSDADITRVGTAMRVRRGIGVVG